MVVDLYKPPPPPVLVVDDHPANRWVLGKLLNRLGLECRFASDGTEAVALAGMRPWGAFVMDIEMPRLDGDIAATRLRRLSSFLADVPIIAVTSLPLEEAKARCHHAKINGLVTKPVTLASLEAELHTHAPSLFPPSVDARGSRRGPTDRCRFYPS